MGAGWRQIGRKEGQETDTEEERKEGQDGSEGGMERPREAGEEGGDRQKPRDPRVGCGRHTAERHRVWGRDGARPGGEKRVEG